MAGPHQVVWASGNHGNTRGVSALGGEHYGALVAQGAFGVLGGLRWFSVEAWEHRVDRAETCWQG